MRKKSIFLFIFALLLSSGGTINAVCSPCETECDECPIIKTMNCDCCSCVVSSKTHFTDRPLYSWISPERESLSYDRTTAKKDGRGGAFQAVLFGGNTTERGRMATYFTPFCSSTLYVKEGVPTDGTDVLAQYFNIATVDGDFESIIRFAPRESVIGLGLTLERRFWEKENGKGYWVALSAPIVRIKHTMGFSEEIINDGGGVRTNVIVQTRDCGSCSDSSSCNNECCDADMTEFVPNMKEAFRQEAWCAGKIDCACDMSKTGLGDIEALFGYDYLRHDHCELDGYVGLVIPTGNRVNTEFLYEPVIGHERHAGFTFGTRGQLCLWQDESEEKSFWYNFHLNSLFLFKNKQQRLVDLVNKPWSRFMRVYRNKEQAQEAFDTADEALSTPGVNIFNQKVEVSPGFQRALSATFVYNRYHFTGEFGVELFCRPAECVKLSCPWVEGAALRAEDGVPGSVDSANLIQTGYLSCNSSASRAVFPQDAMDLYDNYIITECDLDLQSATHPGVITHTFYGAAGYEWDGCRYPMILGIGGSYEMSRDNTYSNRWNAWGKYGISW